MTTAPQARVSRAEELVTAKRPLQPSPGQLETAQRPYAHTPTAEERKLIVKDLARSATTVWESDNITQVISDLCTEKNNYYFRFKKKKCFALQEQ